MHQCLCLQSLNSDMASDILCLVFLKCMYVEVWSLIISLDHFYYVCDIICAIVLTFKFHNFSCLQALIVTWPVTWVFDSDMANDLMLTLTWPVTWVFDNDMASDLSLSQWHSQWLESLTVTWLMTSLVRDLEALIVAWPVTWGFDNDFASDSSIWQWLGQ